MCEHCTPGHMVEHYGQRKAPNLPTLAPRPPAVSDAEPPPDWIILGRTMPDGTVRVVASSNVDNATVQVAPTPQHVEFTDFSDMRNRWMQVWLMRLTAEMRETYTADGADFPEAMRNLAARWRP